jgi:hypothetical protein
MTRLTHSSGGFIRSLQMTSARVFAFVEGRLDRPFFDRLLSQICNPAAIGYRVFAMKELPAGTGGKSALVQTFRDFRHSGLLACTAFGKTMTCVFLADKDSDDFTKRQLRSPHFLYSPTYDLEGHLYSCGDFTRALADASGITTEQAKLLVPDASAWIHTVATHWMDWIALCLVSQSNGVNCGCTYDRSSQVNPDPLAPPDAAKVAVFKSRLASTLAISLNDLETEFDVARRRVDRSIAAGQPLKYFKGKWLSHLIQRHLESNPRIPDALISGVGERIGLSLLAQVALHSNCGCCQAYSPGLKNLVAQL